MSEQSPENQLDKFIGKYTPEIGDLARAALAMMRARLPGAIEMVYDNYNALVIGFGPTERASEAIFSIALYPRWVNLFFLQGATLPDPQKLLKGSGKQVRSITLKDTAVLADAAVLGLMKQAIDRADKPFDSTKPNRLVIKSISAKQRPRCPA